MNITKFPITNNITKLRASRTIKYIVIHYTAGSTSKVGTALAIAKSFNRVGRKASADYIVDDGTIVECNADQLKQYTWACGNPKFDIKNSNSISIEVCSSLKNGTSLSVPNHTGWFFTDKVLDNTLQLTKYLMEKYNIPIDRVVRHFDVNGKACPGIVGWNNAILYTESGTKTTMKNDSTKWEEFKKKLIK